MADTDSSSGTTAGGVRRGRAARGAASRPQKETGPRSFTRSVSAGSMSAVRGVDAGLGKVGRGIWKVFHQAPALAALVGGGVGLGASMLVGVAEAAATVATAYIGYRMFAYDETATEALLRINQIKKGQLQEKKA